MYEEEAAATAGLFSVAGSSRTPAVAGTASQALASGDVSEDHHPVFEAGATCTINYCVRDVEIA